MPGVTSSNATVALESELWQQAYNSIGSLVTHIIYHRDRLQGSEDTPIISQQQAESPWQHENNPSSPISNPSEPLLRDLIRIGIDRVPRQPNTGVTDQASVSSGYDMPEIENIFYSNSSNYNTDRWRSDRIRNRINCARDGRIGDNSAQSCFTQGEEDEASVISFEGVPENMSEVHSLAQQQQPQLQLQQTSSHFPTPQGDSDGELQATNRNSIDSYQPLSSTTITNHNNHAHLSSGSMDGTDESNSEANEDLIYPAPSERSGQDYLESLEVMWQRFFEDTMQAVEEVVERLPEEQERHMYNASPSIHHDEHRNNNSLNYRGSTGGGNGNNGSTNSIASIERLGPPQQLQQHMVNTAGTSIGTLTLNNAGTLNRSTVSQPQQIYNFTMLQADLEQELQNPVHYTTNHSHCYSTHQVLSENGTSNNNYSNNSSNASSSRSLTLPNHLSHSVPLHYSGISPSTTIQTSSSPAHSHHSLHASVHISQPIVQRLVPFSENSSRINQFSFSSPTVPHNNAIQGQGARINGHTSLQLERGQGVFTGTLGPYSTSQNNSVGVTQSSSSVSFIQTPPSSQSTEPPHPVYNTNNSPLPPYQNTAAPHYSIQTTHLNTTPSSPGLNNSYHQRGPIGNNIVSPEAVSSENLSHFLNSLYLHYLIHHMDILTLFNTVLNQYYLESFLWIYFNILLHPASLATRNRIKFLAIVNNQSLEDATWNILIGYMNGFVRGRESLMHEIRSELQSVSGEDSLSIERCYWLRELSVEMGSHLNPRSMLTAFGEVVEQVVMRRTPATHLLARCIDLFVLNSRSVHVLI